MKAAFLISAYTDPSQLGRLLHALNDGDNHFFIHIDAKADIRPFREAVEEGDIPFCTFIEDRYWVQWGGFNQVRYQQALLRAALNSGVRFDRIFIISGQDFPLKPIAEIKREIGKFPSREYMVGLNLSDPKLPEERRARITQYHFGRDVRIRSYTLKKIVSGSLRMIMRMLPFRKKAYIEGGTSRIDVYMSSSYMCITESLAGYVLRQMDENKCLMEYFRHSFVPEEMVIPTIVFNSVYASNACGVEKEYRGLVNLSALTYFRYGKQVAVFNEKDLDELDLCGRLFARKFRSGQSDRLIEILESRKRL